MFIYGGFNYFDFAKEGKSREICWSWVGINRYLISLNTDAISILDVRV